MKYVQWEYVGSFQSCSVYSIYGLIKLGMPIFTIIMTPDSPLMMAPQGSKFSIPEARIEGDLAIGSPLENATNYYEERDCALNFNFCHPRKLNRAIWPLGIFSFARPSVVTYAGIYLLHTHNGCNSPAVIGVSQVVIGSLAK